MSTTVPRTVIDIRDLSDGAAVDQVMLVRSHQLRHTRNGSEFLKLSLSDRTGTVPGVVSDAVADARSILGAGEPLRIVGTYSGGDRYGPQLTVHELHVPVDVDWERLVDGPNTPAHELELTLDALIGGLDDRHLRELLTSMLGPDSVRGVLFRRVCAAQYNHHAYRAGLLEHSLAVAQTVSAAARIMPGIDHDLAVSGALLHDIGKLDAYTATEHSASLNDTGRLIGEIPSGYYAARREIETMPEFPPALAEGLLHIILAHHGRLEYGSPVLPSTREALLVHTMDKLSGDLGSFDRLERESGPGQRWSRHDRALGAIGSRQSLIGRGSTYVASSSSSSASVRISSPITIFSRQGPGIALTPYAAPAS
jgi:3'-5' exoribonuclease